MRLDAGYVGRYSIVVRVCFLEVSMRVWNKVLIETGMYDGFFF